MYDNIFIDIGKQINEAPLDTPIYQYNITDENLKTAAEMFLYIIIPHQEYWLNVHKDYNTMLAVCSLRRLIGEIIINDM